MCSFDICIGELSIIYRVYFLYRRTEIFYVTIASVDRLVDEMIGLRQCEQTSWSQMFYSFQIFTALISRTKYH